MTDKSPWLGHLMGGWGKSSAKPLPTSTRRCEAGHPMAADWTDCPYCAAAQNAGEKTRVGDPASSLDRDAPMAAQRPGPGTTRINTAAGDDAGERAAGGRPPPRRAGTQILPEAHDGRFEPEAVQPSFGGGARAQTKVLPVGESGGPAVAPRRPGPGRRLTGIVYTFSWSPLGEIHEIREGRNFVGSGTVAAEGHRDADVLIGVDSTMSSTHCLILCQGGKYRVSDCNSTNGTFVNGELVDALGIELTDDALILAGATLLAFRKIVPPAGTVAPPPPPVAARPAKDWEELEPDVEAEPKKRQGRDDTLI